MRGKIVWLGDRLFNPFHPNCMGGIVPAVGPFAEVTIWVPHDPRIPAEVRKTMLKRA